MSRKHLTEPQRSSEHRVDGDLSRPSWAFSGNPRSLGRRFPKRRLTLPRAGLFHSSGAPAASSRSLPSAFIIALTLTVAATSIPSLAQSRNPSSPPPKPEDVLILHGINPNPQSIIKFLNKGFSEAALTRGLPAQPKNKTQVVIDAIQELGTLRAKAGVDILMQMCRRHFPDGARQAMRIDLEGMDALTIAAQRKRLEEFLVFNSMVALGWIGDPKAAPAVEELMASKDPTGYITQGALALAMMGKVEGLTKLIDLMENGSPGDATGAARAFYMITGRYYSLTPESSVAKRKAIVKDARQWYEEAGKDFQMTGAEVRHRRLGPYPPNPKPPDLNTIRGLCKASTNVLGNYDSSFRAREKLSRLGSEALPKLEAVARDDMEDNDVRLEALRVYVLLDGADAKPLLKDLDDDDNKPVAERASYVLKHLEEYTKRGVLPK